MYWKGQTVDVPDARGILVQEGDTVASGFDRGIMRLGKVLRYLEIPQEYSGPNRYLEVEWFWSNGLLPEKPTKLNLWFKNNSFEYGAHNFIKVKIGE